MLQWGPSVEIDPKINPKAIMIRASGPQVQTKSMAAQREEAINKVKAERVKLSGHQVDHIAINEDDAVVNIG